MSADSVISQLEQNEDILAAIVENLQLGRLSDCMQHYAILQANLVALANDLDNYPAEENDPYSTFSMFPDEIMRRDVLEDLLPAGTKALPKAPVVPACSDCMAKKIEASVCRGTLRHVELNGRYSASERDEFYNCTQVLSARHQQLDQEHVKKQRPYKVWSKTEKYTLVVGIRIFGTNYPRLMRLLPERNEGQIRSFVTKNLKDGEQWKAELENCSVTQLMDQRPTGYQPPPMLTEFFAAHAAGRDPMDIKWERTTPLGDIDLAATTSTESLLSPEPGRPDFNLLLSIAAGVSTHAPADITTRVPSSPPRAPSAADAVFKPMEGFAVFTEVGQGNSTALGLDTGDSRDDAPLVLASNNTALNSHATAPGMMLPPAALQTSKESSRRVRWDTTVGDAAGAQEIPGPSLTDAYLLSSDTADGKKRRTPTSNTSSSSPSNSQNLNTPLPSLRDHMPANNMPPPPSGAPNFLRDPLKDLLSAAQHQEAMQHQQQMQAQFQAEHERNKREESALAGLESYNLDYARTLQAANIPFKMITQSGTVVVVKSTNPSAGATPSNSVGASATASNGGAGKKPPPFALPGMQRMKQEQKRRRELEDSASNKDKPRQEVLSIPLESFAAKLEAAQQPRLLAQMLAQSQAQAQSYSQAQFTQAQQRGLEAAQSQAPSALLRQPLHNALPSSSAPRAGSASQSAVQSRGTAAQGTTPAVAPSSWGRLSSLGVIVPGSSSGTPSTENVTEGSLLSRILSGVKNPTPRGSSSSSSAGSGAAKASKSKAKRPVPGEQVGSQSQTQSQSQSLSSQFSSQHQSAALEVSLSGYEEEDGHGQAAHRDMYALFNNNSAGSAGGGIAGSNHHGNSEASNSGRQLLPAEELSVLPEFGCEFSFL